MNRVDVTVHGMSVMCSYTNHERSKKHRENVALLKEVMEEEEEERALSLSSDGEGDSQAVPSSHFQTEQLHQSSTEPLEGDIDGGVATLRVANSDSSSNEDLTSLVRYVRIKQC